jgi:tetratricopeptide (TPR) repeat protein
MRSRGVEGAGTRPQRRPQGIEGSQLGYFWSAGAPRRGGELPPHSGLPSANCENADNEAIVPAHRSALHDFNEAIRLKPDYALAFENRGNARRAKGDLDGALRDFHEASRLKK